MKNALYLFAFLFLLILSGCKDIIVFPPTNPPTEPPVDTIPPPPVDPPVVLQSIEWGAATDNGYHVWVLDANTRDTIHSERIGNGDVVGDYEDAYNRLKKYIAYDHIVLEDENGNRILPDICASGGSINLITLKDIENPEGFIYAAPAEPMNFRVLTCGEMPWSPNPNSTIDSVTIREVSQTFVGVNVYNREQCQAVIEFGSYMSADSLIYAGVKENSFNYSVHRLRFGNKSGEALDPGRRYYFQAVVTNQDGSVYRSRIMTATTMK